MRFFGYLVESNTHGADVNEILYGYYLAGGSWSAYGEQATEVQTQVEQKKGLLDVAEFADQDGRAKEMAKSTLKWMYQNGFDTVKHVWWTARKGSVKRIMANPKISDQNPSDLLIRTARGKWLGLSAKSTRSMKGSVGFKNPGWGTLSMFIGYDLENLESDKINSFLSKYPELPSSKAQRKAWLGYNGKKKVVEGVKGDDAETIAYKTKIYKEMDESGKDLLSQLRNILMDGLNNKPEEELRFHLLDEWLNAVNLYPFFIKCTGRGTKGKYSASVENPLKNSKVFALAGDIELVPIGDGDGFSIGVKGSGDKVFKIRIKYESAKLNSSIKLSGDGW